MKHPMSDHSKSECCYSDKVCPVMLIMHNSLTFYREPSSVVITACWASNCIVDGDVL